MRQSKQRSTLTIRVFSQMDNGKIKQEKLRSRSSSEGNYESFAPYNIDPVSTRTTSRNEFEEIDTPRFQNIELMHERLIVENVLDLQQYNTDEHQLQAFHINTVRESLQRKAIQVNSNRNLIRKVSEPTRKISDPDDEPSRILCKNQESKCKCLII